jgi:hypothetical protein
MAPAETPARVGALVRAAELEQPLDCGSRMIAGVSAVANEEVRSVLSSAPASP